MLSKIITFITTDIWRIRLASLSRLKLFLVKSLRIIVLSVRRFDEDKCMLRASALTFYTLLSIVPVFAMAFGIAKGFGFEVLLERQLLEKLQGQEEIFHQIITFSHALLENTKGGLIAGIGIVVLFWTVIKLLGNIENSFNDIWGIKKPRSIARKFTDYLSAMLICPILFIMASSLTVAISNEIKFIVHQFPFFQMLGSLIFSCLKILPYCFVWILFAFLYIFLPNTKVKALSGILAGIIGGTLYQVVQWAYINLQFGVAKYNAIYGGFAALPLFLIWIETSWLIVLLGAEISFAYQNVDTYEFEPDCLEASYSFKKLLTLRIVQVIVKNFQQGLKPLTVDDIVDVLEIPIRLVHQILYDLVACGIINETRPENDKVISYQPSRSIDTLTIGYVINTLEQHGNKTIPVARSAELEEITRRLESFSMQITHSKENACLKDI